MIKEKNNYSKTLNKTFLPYLSCPICKGNLVNAGEKQVYCLSCKTEYPINNGIPVLLPSQIEEFKRLESEYHSNSADDFSTRAGRSSYRVSRYHDDYLQCFSDFKKNKIILNIGCGGGLEALELTKMGHTVILADIAVGMVKTARKLAIKEKQEANSVFVVCDAENLPCPDQSIDAILIVASLHHLPSPAIFFSEVKRTLKPGGLLVVGFEPNRWPYFTVIPVMRLFNRFLNPQQKRKLGETSVADMETIGFAKADFDHFLKAEGLIKVKLQRIWYIAGFVHFALMYVNRNRPSDHLIDLPNSLQRVLVAFDDFISKIPLLRRLCWHWTLVVKRPQIEKDSDQ